MRSFTAALAAFACVLSAHAAAPTLYERLGGAAGVEQIAGRLVDRSSVVHQTARPFEGTDPKRIKRNLAQQICDLTGGPCTYTGDSMRDVHAGHGITQSEMYGLVELLEGVLAELDIGIREKNELLQLLAPMKRDVVEG